MVLVAGSASRAWIHAMGRAGAAHGGACHLRRCMWRRICPALGYLHLSPRNLCRGPARCQLDRILPNVAFRQVYPEPALAFLRAEWPRDTSPAADLTADLCRLASRPLFRQR